MREKKTILESYKPADEYFIINDGDIDLTPIRLSIPSPPPIETIDGYGLEPDEQYFRHVEIPSGIKMIEDQAYDKCVDDYKANSNNAVTGDKLVRTFWEFFEQRRNELDEEVDFIKRVYWHRRHGYWVFIDGKPTYLPPDYYDFLNFYRMADTQKDGGRPEYRDDDRKKYLFWHYLETTTETFANLDAEGNAVKEEDGSYKMVDTGVRVFFGGIEPKVRRSGATHQACHKILKGTTSDFNQYGTIISMDGDNAETHYFKKLMPAFEKYPMFLKPLWDGNYRPRALRFSSRRNDKVGNYLGSVIDYTESAGERKNDGDKLHYYVADEEGKCFQKGTMIRMYSGELKAVEDIKVGDAVMGIDSKPRNVIETHSGVGDLYKVVPNKGDSFVVNGSHTMVAFASDKRYGGTGSRIDFATKDWSSFSKSKQRCLVLKSVGVDYAEKKHTIDPYFLGLWLGDGTEKGSSICNFDEEIKEYLKDFADKNGYNYNFVDGKENTLFSNNGLLIEKFVNGVKVDEYLSAEDAISKNGMGYYWFRRRRKKEVDGIFFKASRRGGIPLVSMLRDIGVLGNKRIPKEYLIDSRDNRLKLLAGLIDSDGHACKEPKRVYEITQKRRELSLDIVELARSLGFYCSINIKNATMKREDGSVYSCDVSRIKIHGRDLDIIPCLVQRKKYSSVFRSSNKNPMHKGFKIEPYGRGEYFGFELDGDRLCLLHDYTIVHNSMGIDVLERWNVNKFTQSTGNGSNIFGFCLHPSTVEQMDEGGMAYYKLCKLSDFYTRIPGKYQTPSGLGLIYFPAYRKLEGFIDRFGVSVIHKPTERQRKLRPDALFAKMNIGAIEYVMKDRDALLAKGTPEAMETYRSIRRKMPIQFAECWIGTSGDLGFDLEIVDRRIAELRRSSRVVTGDFVWENDIMDSRVLFIPKSDGRFEVSLILDPGLSNQKKKEQVWVAKNRRLEYHFAPLYPERFTAGVDTFGYDNKSTAKMRLNKSRQSDGGLAILRERDKETDPGDDMKEWKTFKFILSYRYRPMSTDEFNEDVLKACVYYGATTYIERNKENTWQYFMDRGYAGYLQYDIDPVTGRRAEKPGVFSLTGSKEVLFACTKDYIRYRGHQEDFISYLQEIKSIQGVEEMTLYDRFTAHGLALMGSRSKMGSVYHQNKKEVESSGNFVNALKFLKKRK